MNVRARISRESAALLAARWMDARKNTDTATRITVELNEQAIDEMAHPAADIATRQVMREVRCHTSIRSERE